MKNKAGETGLVLSEVRISDRAPLRVVTGELNLQTMR